MKIITYDGIDIESMTKAELISVLTSISKTINNWSRLKIGTVIDEEGFKKQRNNKVN